MSQFEDLEVNPEKPDHHHIYLYPASGTLEQEIGEELRAMMNVGVPDMRICLFDHPDPEIEHFEVLIEFSHQVAPEFSPDDEVYVFDEAKTDADIGDELFNRLMSLKKSTEKSRITVGLLMSALLLPAAVLAETTSCTPKRTEGDTIIAVDCKVLSAEEIQKSAIKDISTNFGGMHPVINAKGSVTLVAVYDYACADCKKMAPRLLTLAKKHPDIRVIFRNTQGELPNAQLAAQAEKKVWILQGEKAFMHYFSQLFKGQSVKDAMFGVGIAFAGTKEELLGWDVTSDKIAKQTKYFLEELNIKTTPAFIVTATKNPDVNTTTMLTGGVDEKTLLAAVQKAKRGA